MKINYWVWLVLFFALLLAGFVLFRFYQNAAPVKPPPPKLAAVKTALPRVITLYQKGEGESDLAVFVSNELAKKYKGAADFSSADTLNEPQLTEYYGVTAVPTLVFITPAGRVFTRHEGYLDKAGILRILASMKGK